MNKAATAIASYAYTLDAAGHRTGVTELSGRMVGYGYDSIYRLTVLKMQGRPQVTLILMDLWWVASAEARIAPEEPCLRHGEWDRHVTPKRVLQSNFGCCIGTIEKSATYKISGALQRREVPTGTC